PGANGQIAYDKPDPASSGDTFVFTANQDGHHEQQIAPGCCPSWSPDGSQLAISASTPDGRITSAIVNADGSGYRVLPIDDPTLNVGCAVWSPDGTRCAGEGWDDSHPVRNGIYTLRTADGGDRVRVTSNPLGGGHDVPGDYSPDGKQLVFGRYDA